MSWDTVCQTFKDILGCKTTKDFKVLYLGNLTVEAIWKKSDFVETMLDAA